MMIGRFFVLRRSAACPLMTDVSNSGFTYSWAGGVGEGQIAARRCLIGRLLSMLAFLLSNVHSRVLDLLSYAFVSWPPFDPFWCERLPGFMVNTSLSQLSFQLVLVAPALSRLPLLSSPKKKKKKNSSRCPSEHGVWGHGAWTGTKIKKKRQRRGFVIRQALVPFNK